MLIELTIIYILSAVTVCISLYLWHRLDKLTNITTHNAWVAEYRLNNLLKRIEELETKS